MSVVTFPAALGGNGVPYSDDGSTTATMLNGGHKTYLFAALQQLIYATQSASDSAANSTGSTLASGTSTTSIASLPASGSDTATITTQSGKTWVPGQSVIMADSSAPATRWITGLVKSYSSTSLVITVLDAAGTYPGASWTISPAAFARPTSVLVSSVTASVYSVQTTDAGKVLSFAGAASSSIVMPAAATAGAGWFCYVKNTTAIGAGIFCLLAGTGTEKVDGASTVPMYASEMRLVFSTGTGWQSVVLNPFAVMSTSSGSFVNTTGYTGFRATLIGGGGGSGAGGNSSSSAGSGSGGQGGTETRAFIPASQMPASASYIVGGGGSAGTEAPSGAGGSGGAGGAGGATTFLAYSAAGGAGGVGGGNGTGNAAVNSTAPNSWLSAAPNDALTGSTPASNGGGSNSVPNPGVYGGGGGGGGLRMVATNTNAGGATVFGGGGGASGRGWSSASGWDLNAGTGGATLRGAGAAAAYTGTGANGPAGSAANPGNVGYSGGGGASGGNGGINTSPSGAGAIGGAGLFMLVGVV